MTRTILIVDDDAGMLRALERTLRDAGYAVLTAADGSVALRTIATGPAPDLVLLDIFMPERDGFDVLQALRTRTPRIPVIAISGGGIATKATEALGSADLLGAAAILAKPFSPEELLQTVRGVLAS